MYQFFHPLKSLNFDPRTYLRHLWGNISKKKFGSPGAPVTEILTSKILKIPKMLMFRPKKINVPDLILLKYAMHVILKWPQYCIFKIKFSQFSKIKSYWRDIVQLRSENSKKIKTHRFRSIFTFFLVDFFSNSSEKRGQTDSGA